MEKPKRNFRWYVGWVLAMIGRILFYIGKIPQIIGLLFCGLPHTAKGELREFWMVPIAPEDMLNPKVLAENPELLEAIMNAQAEGQEDLTQGGTIIMN